METIPIEKVVEHIDSGQSFDLEFVSLDLNRHKGGKLISLSKAARYRAQRVIDRKGVKPEQGETRNIFDPKERRVIKVHLYLITLFNGKTVS